MERKRMGRPRKAEGKKGVLFSVNLPREVVEAIDAEAERTRATRSEIIRRILIKKIEDGEFF